MTMSLLIEFSLSIRSAVCSLQMSYTDLAAVRNLHITGGYSDPLKGKLLLHKVLRSILRYQSEHCVHRQPVTPQVF